MDFGTLSGIMTGVLILAFLGVCVWAYSSRRKATFDAASRLALEEHAESPPQASGGGDKGQQSS